MSSEYISMFTSFITVEMTPKTTVLHIHTSNTNRCTIQQPPTLNPVFQTLTTNIVFAR